VSEAFKRYRGVHCSECGWDASYQPPEITACLSCDGELHEHYAIGEKPMYVLADEGARVAKELHDEFAQLVERVREAIEV
jgi:hypothetical protein